MQIKAKCPRCREMQTYGPEKAGERVRCRKCRRVFEIPSLANLKNALRVINDAATTVYVDQDGKIFA